MAQKAKSSKLKTGGKKLKIVLRCIKMEVLLLRMHLARFYCYTLL